MEDHNDKRDEENKNKKLDFDLDNDYLLIEGTQILSDYMLFNKKLYLSKAA